MMGWCWVCHKWVWPWQCVKIPKNVALLVHHKACDEEAIKRETEAFEKWYGKDDMGL